MSTIQEYFSSIIQALIGLMLLHWLLIIGLFIQIKQQEQRTHNMLTTLEAKIGFLEHKVYSKDWLKKRISESNKK